MYTAWPSVISAQCQQVSHRNSCLVGHWTQTKFCRAFYCSSYSSVQSQCTSGTAEVSNIIISNIVHHSMHQRNSWRPDILSVTLLQLHCTFRHHCQLHFYIYTVHSDITVSYTFTVTLYIQTSLSVTLLQLHCTFRHHCQLHFYSYTVHSDITVSHCQLLNAPQKQLTVRHQCRLLHIQTSLSVTVHYSMHHRNS